jgi:hypothetical protein
MVELGTLLAFAAFAAKKPEDSAACPLYNMNTLAEMTRAICC